jgi:outer membrane lipoprotein-sorting protein
MRADLRLVLLLLFVSPLFAAGQPLSLEQILVPDDHPRVMRFREVKQLQILEHTLVTTGRLKFIPPDTLIREEDGESRMSYWIQGDQVSIHQGEQQLRRLDLGSTPELAAFATSLRALLAGDREALLQQFELQLSGERDAWLLQLTPRSERLTQILERLVLKGDRHGIRTVETVERGGNRSLMELLPDE